MSSIQSPKHLLESWTWHAAKPYENGKKPNVFSNAASDAYASSFFYWDHFTQYCMFSNVGQNLKRLEKRSLKCFALKSRHWSVPALLLLSGTDILHCKSASRTSPKSPSVKTNSLLVQFTKCSKIFGGLCHLLVGFPNLNNSETLGAFFRMKLFLPRCRKHGRPTTKSH